MRTKVERQPNGKPEATVNVQRRQSDKHPMTVEIDLDALRATAARMNDPACDPDAAVEAVKRKIAAGEVDRLYTALLDKYQAIAPAETDGDAFGFIEMEFLALRQIMDVLAANVEKPTAGIILNHSRNGIKELADAAGFAAANYGKNSKAIFSVMRNVWNLRPAHFAEPVTKIELIHAKSSDFAAYEPRAVDFDPNTFSYSLDHTFSHEAWQYELERARRNGSAMPPEMKADEYKRKCEEMRRRILEYVTSKGYLYKSELDEWMRFEGMPKNTAQNIYSDMVQAKELARVKERRPNSAVVVVGIPSAISKMLSESQPNKYIRD